MAETAKHSLWLGIVERGVSFLVVFTAAAIWIGGTRQKIAQKVTTLEMEMADWKAEWKLEKAHITQMDLEGSVATRNFVQHYNEEQAKQYKRLEKLEEQTAHLETLSWRVERLDRKVFDGQTPTP